MRFSKKFMIKLAAIAGSGLCVTACNNRVYEYDVGEDLKVIGSPYIYTCHNKRPDGSNFPAVLTLLRDIKTSKEMFVLYQWEYAGTDDAGIAPILGVIDRRTRSLIPVDSPAHPFFGNKSVETRVTNIGPVVYDSTMRKCGRNMEQEFYKIPRPAEPVVRHENPNLNLT